MITRLLSSSLFIVLVGCFTSTNTALVKPKAGGVSSQGLSELDRSISLNDTTLDRALWALKPESGDAVIANAE